MQKELKEVKDRKLLRLHSDLLDLSNDVDALSLWCVCWML